MSVLSDAAAVAAAAATNAHLNSNIFSIFNGHRGEKKNCVRSSTSTSSHHKFNFQLHPIETFISHLSRSLRDIKEQRKRGTQNGKKVIVNSRVKIQRNMNAKCNRNSFSAEPLTSIICSCAVGRVRGSGESEKNKPILPFPLLSARTSSYACRGHGHHRHRATRW